jgi:phospholipid/cholesterol/gamma-HCH transport system substrate-binding protein
MRRELRVGILVVVTLVVLIFGILVVGGQNDLFSQKNTYSIRFSTVSGLKPNNPVQLNGVEIGRVDRVVLPTDPTQVQIEVWINIDRKYARRLRAPDYPVPDSAPATKARIQTLGLLGDKYIELSSGAESYPEIPPSGQIPAAAPTNVDALIASGGDVMGNILEISHSLAAILGRVERGQGLLGELTVDSAAGHQLQQSVIRTAASLQGAANALERGRGPLGRMLNDRGLGDQLAQAIDHVNDILGQASNGPGLLPALLNDPGSRTRFEDTLVSLNKAANDFQSFTTDLAGQKGLLPKLVHDEGYAQELSGKLRQIIDHLNSVADKLDEGPGTAGRLLNDPSVYEALDNVIVGVNQSPMLRWLIRNRQKAGITRRYNDAEHGTENGTGPPSTPPEQPPPNVLAPPTPPPAE